ncbi:3-hydroxyacyl-CoA dehydrogenase NAD-binding domain-containing protein [Streptomyces sp. NPDC032161]|uniref:3-hydroxyacyl-CoA dehydrogenase NAD-binding domain-containing protein n=1 Tax=unclassified Streptomyces TaxID=2593676 RepID=UPI0034118175
MSKTTTQNAVTVPVRYEVEHRVAVLTIDNPPVNASTAAVRAGLLAGVTQAANDDDVVAIVLIGNDRAFISGSDLREFDGPLPEPQLPQVIAAVEACPKPVVAALAGAALGGGFELALGCDARVAAHSALVGLPEVSLGMIPGAGGTQRLPRIVGTARAIELVCGTRRVKAAEALELGIVDALADGDLRDFAVSYAATTATKRVLISQPVPSGPADAVDATAQTALSRGKGRPHVVAAVGAVLLASAVGAPEALRHERAEFNRLRLGSEASALRHLFFAERATAREYRRTGTREVRRVGVVGAGTMGSGIARAALDAGYTVVLVEADAQALAAGSQRIAEGYARAVSRQHLSDEARRDRLDRLTSSLTYADLAACDLVIEAVFEEPDVKCSVLAQIDAVVRPDTVVASNTSYLDLDELAASTADPTRVVGMHFFSPAHATKVVEVVRGTASTDAAVATAIAVGRALRKVPIVAGVGFGFIGNRIFNAYRRQCELMLEEGAQPWQVDQALQGFGFAMGPFAVADMSGLDIAWRMRKGQAATRDPRARYVRIADLLCEEGRLGQKTGKGWYAYPAGSTTPVRDPEVEALVEGESARAGIERRPFSGDEIVQRAVLAMANEAALVLGEGIATRASDVDLMLTLGYGFPRHQGGPAFWSRWQDPQELLGRLDELATATGHGFVPGDLSLLTRE